MDSETASSVNASVSGAENAFKSSLPPRKRAKTQEEKEQRRVERILRNRRAAHASREKKRKHVELLEEYVINLEANMAKLLANYDAVYSVLLASQRQQVSSLIDSKVLSDVSQLKGKITENLNCSVADFEKQRQKKLKGRKLSASAAISDSEDEEMDDDAVSSGDMSRDSPVSDEVFTSSNSLSVKEETMSVHSEVFSSNESVGSHASVSTAASSVAADVENDLFIKQESQNESYKLTFASAETDDLLLGASTVVDDSHVTGTTNESNYLQYLSPISINSPTHSSPIDLTLNTLANDYDGEFAELLKGPTEPMDVTTTSDGSSLGLQSTLPSTGSFSKKSTISSGNSTVHNAPIPSMYDYMGQNPEVILFSLSRLVCCA